jgi:hypothetical protein
MGDEDDVRPDRLLYLSSEDRDGHGTNTSTYFLGQSISSYLKLEFAPRIIPEGGDPIKITHAVWKAYDKVSREKSILWIDAHGKKNGSLEIPEKVALEDWTGSLKNSSFRGVVVSACSVGKKLDANVCLDWGCEWVLAAGTEADWYSAFCAYAKALEWLYYSDPCDTQENAALAALNAESTIEGRIQRGLTYDWGKDKTDRYDQIFLSNQILLITRNGKFSLPIPTKEQNVP